jgi:iron(III) transport system permease protein
MGGLVAGAIALPLVYLVIRAFGIEAGDLWPLLLRPRNWGVMVNSIAAAATVTLFSLIIAFPIALLTLRTDLPLRRWWLIATIMPLAIPSYVGSFAIIAALSPRGSLLQMALAPLGVEELPSLYGFPGTVLSITLFTYPYLLLSIRAGLQGLDPSLEEAALSLGYSPRQVMTRVVLPQLRPSIVGGSLLVALYALRDFGTPSLMRFDTFTREIFIQYKTSFNRNAAAGLALMLVAVVATMLWLEYLARSRQVYYSRGSAVRRPVKIIPLGIWKWPALAFCGVIVALAVLLPIGVTIFWLLVDRGDNLPMAALLGSAVNSLIAATLAAGVTIACALPVAILAVRYPSKITVIIERSTYLSFGMPGIVIALALVFLGANNLPWVHQTLPMLILAYLIIFLPQSLSTIQSALLQVSPQLEEAARSLGRHQHQVWWEVTIPLVKNGIIGGAVLVFLTAVKELPATILLAPIGFDTLALQIWYATDDLNFAGAAWASLLMLLVSIATTSLLVDREKL